MLLYACLNTVAILFRKLIEELFEQQFQIVEEELPEASLEILRIS